MGQIDVKTAGASGLTKISPSILSSDFGKLRDEVALIDKAGADSVHIDVMDGHFVPNITFGPVVISSVRGATKLPFETHLMVDNPDRLIKDFADAGSDLLIVHPEAKHDLKKTLTSIEDLGKKTGIALNPETPLDAILKIIDRADMLLVMTVHPGFSGQKFITEMLGKIRQARSYIDREGVRASILVDGGVTLETGRKSVDAGADGLVAGTSVFKSPDVAEAIRKFSLL